uniref:Anaphase-promoting complex subunit 4 WD40 domain-containing protein n=1 Tax=Ciona savignyi TaxID=51511 RepID=H2ZHD8_CIOSA
MCWNPSSDYKHCIALGLMNGKTALRIVGSGSGDRQYPIFKELVSKCSRPCNALAWSPLNPTWLATGFEKHRGAKYSLLIWDI